MSDTHWWFFDLAVVIAVAGVVAFGVFSGIDGAVRIVAMIPLVVFLPGYALVSALFPDKPDDDYQSFDEEKTGLGNPLLVTGGLETIERFVLSVVCSVALVSSIALLSSATPRGLTLEPVLSGISLLTVILTLIAIGCRYRCSPERRYAPSFSFGSLFFGRDGPNIYAQTNPRPYNVAIVLGLVLVVATAGFAVANPPERNGFTEFSVETEPVTGDVETMYESTYTAGESQELQAAITNQEGDERTYTTVALLQEVSYEDGVTVRETAEMDRRSTTIADGETREQTLEITPTTDGPEFRLTLLLYEDEPPTEPTADSAYRVIQLPIDVE
ncbi:DUF1616 domain-containing protein [Natronorubrum sp. JWXQ-INN-674]|uniref:DUF1616 domain-containing protein n=1 Tax=Natronorubrum halalkaliphilum TaxID=2691917 RepID=A0A6B0VR52_9EURY|nr:DUF1616 domain-containing protein [Natronorubrum halalkaliphilum]MXV64120.1 DUF1616 domain-containing protein [Natronorubrum halalkaliphilum]